MTQNNETQNTQNPQGGQADFNKSQQGGGGENKQTRNQDQTLSQNKDQGDRTLAGQEEKTFQGSQANPAEGKADQAQQFAKGGSEAETEIDDKDDTQAETSNT